MPSPAAVGVAVGVVVGGVAVGGKGGVAVRVGVGGGGGGARGGGSGRVGVVASSGGRRPEPPFPTTRSGLPSPLKSGDTRTRDDGPVENVCAAPKAPLPLFTKKETKDELPLTAARSSSPS